tara:strand:+ start:404 stop:505 length:102 start_codon:yes stop_codon:yes gene_type:complete
MGAGYKDLLGGFGGTGLVGRGSESGIWDEKVGN